MMYWDIPVVATVPQKEKTAVTGDNMDRMMYGWAISRHKLQVVQAGCASEAAFSGSFSGGIQTPQTQRSLPASTCCFILVCKSS